MPSIGLNIKNIATLVALVVIVYVIYSYGSREPSVPVVAVRERLDWAEVIAAGIYAVQLGGAAVRQVYAETNGDDPRGSNLDIQSKGKTKEGAQELLTRADLLSNALIVQALNAKLPGVKIVSEEKESNLKADELFEFSSKLKSDFWTPADAYAEKFPKSQGLNLNEITIWVDPLDATQEYTEGLTQYVTTMMCVAIQGVPRFGVIYRVFDDETVCGLHDIGVFGSAITDSDTYLREADARMKSADKAIAIVSRSHAGTVKDVVQSAFPQQSGDPGQEVETGKQWEVEPAGGSGYKSLRVLNGTAAIYVHTTKIKKWDICAGNAIIAAAGGHMTTLDGEAVTYFSQDSVANENGLLVTRGPNHNEMLEKLGKSLKQQ